MNKSLLYITFLFLSALPAKSQNDSAMIRQAALNYVEGFYTANWQRMTKDADVTIYDIYNKVATVKVVTNKFRFIDYLHLGKFNGEWKIVNVLWEFPQ